MATEQTLEELRARRQSVTVSAQGKPELVVYPLKSYSLCGLWGGVPQHRHEWRRTRN